MSNDSKEDDKTAAAEIEEQGSKESGEKGSGESSEEKKDEEKYKDWPFRNVKEPHANDVLYGRGGTLTPNL